MSPNGDASATTDGAATPDSHPRIAHETRGLTPAHHVRGDVRRSSSSRVAKDRSNRHDSLSQHGRIYGRIFTDFPTLPYAERQRMIRARSLRHLKGARRSRSRRVLTHLYWFSTSSFSFLHVNAPTFSNYPLILGDDEETRAQLRRAPHHARNLDDARSHKRVHRGGHVTARRFFPPSPSPHDDIDRLLARHYNFDSKSDFS